MRIVIIGASRGLGRSFTEAMLTDGHEVVGVSRMVPDDLVSIGARWIAADLAEPRKAAAVIAEQTPDVIDVVIHNVGIWEPNSYSPSYDFATESDDVTE